jgi:hypothetical protein
MSKQNSIDLNKKLSSVTNANIARENIPIKSFDKDMVEFKAT